MCYVLYGCLREVRFIYVLCVMSHTVAKSAAHTTPCKRNIPFYIVIYYIKGYISLAPSSNTKTHKHITHICLPIPRHPDILMASSVFRE
jgi:hypothetical protein